MTETTDQPPPAPVPPTSTDPFDRLRDLGIARPADGRWIAGVSAGLARRWTLDPLLVRLAFVALTLVSGVGLLIYGLAWALLPEEDGRIHLQEMTRGRLSAGLFGAAGFLLLFLAAAGDNNGPFWWGIPGTIVLGVLIAVGIWTWSEQRKKAPQQLTGTMPPRPAQALPYTGAPYGYTGPAATMARNSPLGSACRSSAAVAI